MEEKEEQTYLIPANTKAGALILGYFRPVDLIILGSGVLITLLLLFVVQTTNTLTTILVLAPGVICGFLVLPIPNYHNVITIIISIINFFQERRVYIWKGWCIYDGDKK